MGERSSGTFICRASSPEARVHEDLPMPAPSNRQQNSRAPSDDRPFDHPEDLFDDGSFRQGANITDGPQESRSRGGGFSEVSPGGGEYLSGGPRLYGSDAYPDQGFGKKTRASSHWRTED